MASVEREFQWRTERPSIHVVFVGRTVEFSAPAAIVPIVARSFVSGPFAADLLDYGCLAAASSRTVSGLIRVDMISLSDFEFSRRALPSRSALSVKVAAPR